MGEEEKEETLTDDRMTSGMRAETESRSNLALFTCVWFGRWGGGAVEVGGWVGWWRYSLTCWWERKDTLGCV